MKLGLLTACLPQRSLADLAACAGTPRARRQVCRLPTAPCGRLSSLDIRAIVGRQVPTSSEAPTWDGRFG
jgi:hypothetical protein